MAQEGHPERYRPSHTGLRFSTKALTPSTMFSVESAGLSRERRNSIASAKATSCRPDIAPLPSLMITSDIEASVSAGVETTASDSAGRIKLYAWSVKRRAQRLDHPTSECMIRLLHLAGIHDVPCHNKSRTPVSAALLQMNSFRPRSSQRRYCWSHERLSRKGHGIAGRDAVWVSLRSRDRDAQLAAR